MGPTEVAALMKIVIDGMALIEQLGGNASKLAELYQKARAEGREVTADELRALSSDAQSAIDKL